MSRTLYYRPQIQVEERDSKNIKLMDALIAYFASDGPFVLTVENINLLRVLRDIFDGSNKSEIDSLISIINRHGGVLIEIRR